MGSANACATHGSVRSLALDAHRKSVGSVLLASEVPDPA